MGAANEARGTQRAAMAMEEPCRRQSDGRLAARRAAPKGERRPDPRQWERPQRQRRRAGSRGALQAGARERPRPRQAIVAEGRDGVAPARRSLAFARERLAEQSAAARQRGAARRPGKKRYNRKWLNVRP